LVASPLHKRKFLNLKRRSKFLSQLPPEFKNSVTERDLPDQEALVIRLKKLEKVDVLDLLLEPTPL
jgi:hypothetical protein